MIIKEHFIECNKVSTWNLRPFGDLQFGAPGFQENLWTKWAAETKDDPFALTIGMGDYSDWWRPTAQTKLDIASAGDPDMKDSIDTLHQSHMQKVFDKLAPIINSKRCFGLLAGHHDFTYATGINSTQWLCDKLRVSYLGEMAYIRLLFIGKNWRKMGGHGAGHRWVVKIHAQHGDGGSGFIGSDIGNLERKTMPYWRGDLFLRGHSTKRWTAPSGEYDITDGPHPRLIWRDAYLVNTGGFMSGYVEASTTYVSKKNMPPANLGYAVVHLKLERHRARLADLTETINEVNNIKITVTQ